MTYLSIGPNVWGKGNTKEAARRKAERAFGKPMKDFLMYEAEDPEVCVSGMGNIEFAQGTRVTLLYGMRAGKRIDPNDM